MSELINRWFSRTARVPGLLATGLRYADSTTFSRTWEVHLAEPLLNEVWTRLHPIAETAGVESAELDVRQAHRGGRAAHKWSDVLRPARP